MNFDASTFTNGASTRRAIRRAISVLPTPVGPIIRMFFGVISRATSGGELLPAPPLAQRDGDGPLRLRLADDVPVELGDDLPRREVAARRRGPHGRVSTRIASFV